MPGLGSFGTNMLGVGGTPDAEMAEAHPAGGAASLVTAKEERDLAALLELFALGVGDVEEFQDRLQAELAALEASRNSFTAGNVQHS